MSEKRVAVVTGGSSGIGRCTAEFFVQAGLTVYELSRGGEDRGGVIHLTADVTDDASVTAAMGEIIGREGRIDILVNNAGYGISGAVEFTDVAQAQRQMDVNFFGAVRATHAVLPHMRRQGSGSIVCISSVAAPVPIPFQTYYSVSKAAIDVFARALRLEVAPFGVSVCTVMLGDTKTGFTAVRSKLHEGDEVYGGRISRSVAMMEKDEQSGMPPESAARAVVNAALKKKTRPLIVVGAKYKLFVMLSRLLPSALVSKIVGKLYAS